MESTLGAVFTPSDSTGSDRCVIALDSDNVPMDRFCEMFRQRRGLPSINSSFHITESIPRGSNQHTVMEYMDGQNVEQVWESGNKDDNAIVSTVFRSNGKRMRLNKEKGVAKNYEETNGQRFADMHKIPLEPRSKVKLRSEDGENNHKTGKEFFRQSLQCVSQYNDMRKKDTRVLRDLNPMVPALTTQVYMVHNQQSNSAGIYPTTTQHLLVNDNSSDEDMREQQLQCGESNGGLSENGDIRRGSMEMVRKNDEGSTSDCVRNQTFTDDAARTEAYLYWTKGDPSVFINAGFFYTGDQDIVRCFHCDIGIAGWNPTDDPWVEHARYRPDCLFLRQAKSQEWIDTIQTAWAKSYTPKHPEYQRVDVRKRSFQNGDWQRNNPSQSSGHLAVAGFFLDDDRIRCHYCDGILREDVDIDDDRDEDTDALWIKHAQTFPFCKYVQYQKGSDFVKTCQLESSAIQQPDHYLPVTAGPEGHVFRLSCVQEFSIRAERDPMWSAAAKSLLSLGYSKESVTRSIHTFISENSESREFDAKTLIDIIQRYEDALLENQQLKQRFQCKHCHERNISRIAVPCGHLACQQCLAGLGTCNICHSEIRENVRIYFS